MTQKNKSWVITQAELDSLSDVDLQALRKATQALATQSQRVTQRYQRQVARFDSELCRRSAKAKRAA